MTMPAPTENERSYAAQWFRSWHGAPTDIKWLLIADIAETTPGNVMAVVWALLDYASQNQDRGSIKGFHVAALSAFSRIPATTITAIVNALQGIDVLDADFRFASWDKRQPKREDNSTERVRQHRARKTEATLNPELLFDAIETQCNAMERVETEVQREETPSNAPDKIREEENIDDANASSAPRPLTPHQELVGAIAEVCRKDPKIRSHASRLGLVATNLTKAGYNAQHVRNFAAWWPTDGWRKEHTPTPSLAQLEDKIREGANYQARAAPANSNGANRPDPPQQQRLRALRENVATES